MKSQKSFSRYDSKEYKEELKHQKKLRKIERKGERILRKRELKAKLNSYKEPKKKFPTSKLIAVYLFILLNVVLIYSMIMMYLFRDLTYLGVLLSDIVAQVITYMIYMIKSTKENTVGGITYDTAMFNLQNQNITQTINDNDAVG